jgi:hypothetical protein
MDRRTFLLGIIGGIAAATGLAGHTTPAEAGPIGPDSSSIEPDLEPAVMPEDSDSVQAQYAQWGYYGPRRRYWRRSQTLLAPPLLLRAAVLLRRSLSPPLASRPPPLLVNRVGALARRADGHRRSGCRPGTLRKSGRLPGIHAGVPDRNILLTTCGTIMVVDIAS